MKRSVIAVAAALGFLCLWQGACEKPLRHSDKSQSGLRGGYAEPKRAGESEGMPVDPCNRVEAQKMFEAARDHASRGNFEEAKRSFERSLELCEDSVVRTAYQEFLATIGPL